MLPFRRASVIIAAYNEENTIAEVIENCGNRFKELGIQTTFVVIDDGSTDSTSSCARKSLEKWPGSKLLCFPCNRGKGCAVRAGIHSVNSDVLFLIPGDGQFDISSISEMLRLLRKNSIVHAYRDRALRLPSAAKLSWFYNTVVSLLFGIKCKDINWVFAARTEVLKSIPLRSRGFAIEAEIILRLYRGGIKAALIKSNELPRNHGDGNGRNFRYLLHTAAELLALWGRLHITGDELPDHPDKLAAQS